MSDEWQKIFVAYTSTTLIIFFLAFVDLDWLYVKVEEFILSFKRYVERKKFERWVKKSLYFHNEKRGE